MSPFTREQLLELSSGYALGALSSEEMAAVEAALPGDAGLAAEVLAMRETMGTILRAEAPMAPRASLRDAWLERARAVKSGGSPAANARVADARRRGRPSSWLVGAALAASLTGIAVLGVQLQRTRDDLTVATAAEAQRERQLNTVLEAEAGLLVAMLKGSDPQGPGVQFFWNVRQQLGMVHAFHLPPAPAGHVYQVWVLRGPTPISVRVFDSDADGHALIEKIVLPDSPDGISTVAITVEPAGGSPQPTTTPILAGELLRRAGQ